MARIFQLTLWDRVFPAETRRKGVRDWGAVERCACATSFAQSYLPGAQGFPGGSGCTLQEEAGQSLCNSSYYFVVNYVSLMPHVHLPGITPIRRICMIESCQRAAFFERNGTWLSVNQAFMPQDTYRVIKTVICYEHSSRQMMLHFWLLARFCQNCQLSRHWVIWNDSESCFWCRKTSRRHQKPRHIESCASSLATLQVQITSAPSLSAYGQTACNFRAHAVANQHVAAEQWRVPERMLLQWRDT